MKVHFYKQLQVSSFFEKFVLWFTWKRKGKKGGRKGESYLPWTSSFPKYPHQPGWPKPNPEARSSARVSQEGDRCLSTWSIIGYYPGTGKRGAKMHWDVGIAICEHLTCSASRLNHIFVPQKSSVWSYSVIEVFNNDILRLSKQTSKS